LIIINPMDLFLIKNNDFDPKIPKTYFLHRSTRFDPYWPGGFGFHRKWYFDPKRSETHFLPWSTWFDLYWPGGLGFDEKMTVDPRKIYFWILNFFLIFMNKNINKIIYEKILENSKLGYYNNLLLFFKFL